MNRFDAFEVSPVLETDVDGMGGLVCQAFPTFAEAEAALAAAQQEEVTGRIFWTLYGHTPGEGAEAISDFSTEEAAFGLLYRLTGIAGSPGVTVYKLPHPQTVTVWTCTGDTDDGMITTVHSNEHAAQTELLERVARHSLSEEEKDRGVALLASGQEHDGYEAFGDFIEEMKDFLDTFSVEPHTLSL